MTSEFDKAIEINDGIYWVGQRDPNSLLQVNAYMKRFHGNSKSINMMIDPGPLEHFGEISRKVGTIIQDIAKVNMYAINHPDPDVGMNSTFLAKMNPRSICLCSEDTWRLVKFFEIPAKNYKNVYSFKENSITLATSSEHQIQFVPTPYCHFVGAVAVYDRASRTLFTGDLFGGLNPPNNLSLYATEEHWEGVKMFHQLYMPSQKALRNAIDNIRALDPPPTMIVPQHGAIIKEDLLDVFMARLYNLETGTDLFNKPDQSKMVKAYEDLINTLFKKFVDSTGTEEADLLFDFADRTQEMMVIMDLQATGLKRIFSQPEDALNVFLKKISHYHENALVNEIKSLAIKECLMNRLPMPISNLYSSDAEADESLIAEPDNHDDDDLLIM